MIRVEPIKAGAKKRSPYRGGKTAAKTKPWLKEDPPMSRATWYRLRAKEKSK